MPYVGPEDMTEVELAKLMETETVTRHWAGKVKEHAAALGENPSYSDVLAWVRDFHDLVWKVRMGLSYEQQARSVWHGGPEPEPVRTEDGLSLEDLGL